MIPEHRREGRRRAPDQEARQEPLWLQGLSPAWSGNDVNVDGRHKLVSSSRRTPETPTPAPLAIRENRAIRRAPCRPGRFSRRPQGRPQSEIPRRRPIC